MEEAILRINVYAGHQRSRLPKWTAISKNIWSGQDVRNMVWFSLGALLFLPSPNRCDILPSLLLSRPFPALQIVQFSFSVAYSDLAHVEAMLKVANNLTSYTHLCTEISKINDWKQWHRFSRTDSLRIPFQYIPTQIHKGR